MATASRLFSGSETVSPSSRSCASSNDKSRLIDTSTNADEVVSDDTVGASGTKDTEGLDPGRESVDDLDGAVAAHSPNGHAGRLLTSVPRINVGLECTIDASSGAGMIRCLVHIE